MLLHSGQNFTIIAKLTPEKSSGNLMQNKKESIVDFKHYLSQNVVVQLIGDRSGKYFTK